MKVKMLLWPHMHAENYPNAWYMCLNLCKRLLNSCALKQLVSHYVTRYVFAVNVSECLRCSLWFR